MPYIPKQKHHTLTQFKYNGGSDSLTYQYIWSPLGQYLLKFFPLWVAPNLITFVALLMLIIVNIIFMLPDQNDIIPSWKLIMMAVSILIYQNLDNIDGKQARRTKSSSPLGMLFDHGSDAVTGFLLGIQVMKIFHLSYSFQLFTITLFIMGSYFCAMWSQYCIGIFRLARINPIDQGLPTYALTCIIFSQMDLSFMSQYHIIGTYGQQLIYAMTLGLFPVMITMIKDIPTKCQVPKKTAMFMPLLYFLTAITLYITDKATSNWTRLSFYCFLYSLAFMWSRNMINIQLYYITKQNYKVFNRGTLSFIIPCLLYKILSIKFNINQQLFFITLFVVQFIVFIQFVVRVLNQGTQILNIFLFSLKPRTRKSFKNQ